MVMTTPITWLMLTEVKSVLHVSKIGQGASRKRFVRSSVPNLTGAWSDIPKGWMEHQASRPLIFRSISAPRSRGMPAPAYAFVVLCAANRLPLAAAV
jgi:hypothetical protein